VVEEEGAFEDNGVAEEAEEAVEEAGEAEEIVGEAEVGDEAEVETAVQNLLATRNTTAHNWFLYLK